MKKNHEFKRYPVATMAWFLQSIGINLFSTGRKNINITYRLVAFYFGILCAISGITMFGIMNRNRFEEAIIIAAFLGSNIIIAIAIPNIFHNRYKLNELLFKMDENIFVYPDEDDIRVEYNSLLHENQTNNLIKWVFLYVCFGFSLSGVSPFIGLYLTGEFKTQMYPAWYSWKGDNLVSASITFFIQWVTSICVFWSIFLFQIFSSLVVIEFLRQYRRLCIALCTMDERGKKLFVKKTFGENANVDWDRLNCINHKHSKFTHRQVLIFNEIYRQKMICCILHHQQLWKSFNLFKPWYTVLFSVELVISAVTFGLVFYNVLQMTNYERSFAILGSSFEVLTNLFNRCFIGEILSEMNGEVTDTIFHEVNWYEQSLPNRRMLLILHHLTKRPHGILAFKFFKASNLIFGKITKVSYSYFNILKRK